MNSWHKESLRNVHSAKLLFLKMKDVIVSLAVYVKKAAVGCAGMDFNLQAKHMLI